MCKRKEVILMNLELFSNPEYEDYQVKVIAPTHTYGTVTDFDSDYAFEVDYDEYDLSGKWEYRVVVKDETLATFDNIEDAVSFIEETDFDFYEME